MKWYHYVKIAIRVITVLPIIIKGVRAELKRYKILAKAENDAQNVNEALKNDQEEA